LLFSGLAWRRLWLGLWLGLWLSSLLGLGLFHRRCRWLRSLLLVTPCNLILSGTTLTLFLSLVLRLRLRRSLIGGLKEGEQIVRLYTILCHGASISMSFSFGLVLYVCVALVAANNTTGSG